MIIYGLKTCDTCRKARKSLPEASFADVREDGIPQSVLSDALARFGQDLVNTRSTTWRALTEVERGTTPLELLQKFPTLMKRPLIVSGDDMWLGWTKQVQATLLG